MLRCLVAIVVLWGPTACKPADEKLQLGSTRGLILISVDTLSARHLGLYGYERDTSPFLDSLAEESIVFDRAFVHFPGTLPSHMSMFTGLYPGEHGVYPPSAVLSERIETLPQILARSGFRTAGFTEGGYVSAHFGFDRGFEVFSDSVDHIPKDVEKTFRRGLDFLDSVGSEDRFFLFLHTYTVHDPYDPPEPFRSVFWRLPVPETFEPTGPNLGAFNKGLLELSEPGTRYFEALYDAGIRYLDQNLEVFFRELSDRELLDETTLIITSDHGEEFLEHGKLAHEQLYPEILQVPLILVHPSVDRQVRIDSIARTIDIPVTLLDIAGIEFEGAMSGSSLIPKIHGEQETGDSGTVALAEAADRGGKALVTVHGQRMFQLNRFDLQRGQSSEWVSRSVAFDWGPDEPPLSVVSYFRERVLSVEVDGEVIDRVLIHPNRITQIALDVEPRVGGHRVHLSTPSCDSPAAVTDSVDSRCLSFRIADATLERTELYDLIEDPGANRDLSRLQPELLGLLEARLNDFQPLSEEPPSTHPLGESLAEELKALGYLE